MTNDPEHERIEELLGRSRTGEATEAEREELELYVKSQPELRALVERSQRERELGEGWLQRVEADEKLQALGASPRVRLERGLGLGLLVAGFGLNLVAPAVGGIAMGTGVLVLLYSFLRARFAEQKSDPYKDVLR
jgi:ferric-dicitrate binding protein FerR (iron transport regulator)